jgi:hypothetical protein
MIIDILKKTGWRCLDAAKKMQAELEASKSKRS